MLSLRHFRRRRAPWHALVFWVWLAGFVFFAAASEGMHAPNCPEILLLQQAGHAARPAAVSPAMPLLHLGIECAACAFQLAAAAIPVALTFTLVAHFAALEFAAWRRLNGASRSLLPLARGPPAQPRPVSSL